MLTHTDKNRRESIQKALAPSAPLRYAPRLGGRSPSMGELLCKEELETLRLQKKLSKLLNVLLFLLLLILSSQQVHADVFKCKLKDGGTAYQPTACPASDSAVKVPIKKRDPDKEAIAEAELAQWQSQQNAYKIALVTARKELAAETDRRNTVIALQKTADAQKQQAYELQREADAQFERNRIKYYGVNAQLIINPYSRH